MFRSKQTPTPPKPEIADYQYKIVEAEKYSSPNSPDGHIETISGYFRNATLLGSGVVGTAAASVEFLRHYQWDGSRRLLPAEFTFRMKAHQDRRWERMQMTVDGFVDRAERSGFEIHPRSTSKKAVAFDRGNGLVAGAQEGQDERGGIFVAGLLESKSPVATLAELIDYELPTTLAVFNNIFPDSRNHGEPTLESDKVHKAFLAGIEVTQDASLAPVLQSHLRVVK